jgi:hypothetical protein
MGVAQTEHKFEKNLKIDQGLVACVGGVVTVLNESEDTIHPGDHLVLGLPHGGAMQSGIPKQKMRFVFQRAPPTQTTDTIIDKFFEWYMRQHEEHTSSTSEDWTMSEGKDDRGEEHESSSMMASSISSSISSSIPSAPPAYVISADEPPETPENQIQPMRNKLREMFKKKGPRFIAKALSYAKKGAKLDILLYPRQSA